MWPAKEQAWQQGYDFWGPAPNKVWEGQKYPKFGAIFHNFRLWSQMFPEQIHITKIGNALDQLQTLPYWTIGELWSTNKKVIGTHVDPPKWTFSRDYISVLPPQILTRPTTP